MYKQYHSWRWTADHAYVHMYIHTMQYIHSNVLTSWKQKFVLDAEPTK